MGPGRKPRRPVFSERSSYNHGGNSKGTTCVVDRDVTAYLVVDLVLRFPTEQYGCRYVGYLGLNDVKVIFWAYFVILLSECVSRIFFFLAKSVGKLLCRRFSYEEQVQAKMQK